MNNPEPLALPSPAPEPEMTTLAYDLALAYRRMVEFYRTSTVGLTEADAKVQEVLKVRNSEVDERLRHGPPQEVTWWQLQELTEQDPQAAQQRWESIKEAARDELQCGYRAARTLEAFNPTPWERAQFLAMRYVLMQEWQPRNGIEQTLLDTMAQAQTYYMTWLQVLTNFLNMESERQQSKMKQHGEWQLPRVSDYEAIEQAAAMVDRFNKLFLRTLRQLRDLRRYAPAVTIQSAGQVNIGSQQVNMAQTQSP